MIRLVVHLLTTLDPANPPTTGLVPGTYVYYVTDATGYPASAMVVHQCSSFTAGAYGDCHCQPDVFRRSNRCRNPELQRVEHLNYTYDPLNPPLTGLQEVHTPIGLRMRMVARPRPLLPSVPHRCWLSTTPGFVTPARLT